MAKLIHLDHQFIPIRREASSKPDPKVQKNREEGDDVMRRKHGFYGAPSALALALALGGAPAFGQDAAQSGDAEQLGAPAGADAIVVTGTRITSGFTAPTPVTVQTADELLTSAPGTLADGLNQDRKSTRLNSSH